MTTSNGYKLSQLFIHIIFLTICVVIVLPLVLLISISFTSEADIVNHGYRIIPKSFDLSAYKYALTSLDYLINAYKVSFFITVVGTAGGILFTAMAGYVLSRKGFRYQSILTFYVIFTLLFQGGIVSYYIVISQMLGLSDHLLALILPGLLSGFYIIIMRGFMSDIPMEIIESVKIDGGNEFTTFFRVILPLSKPALTTIGLLIAFNYWNEVFNALLFINSDHLVPIQLLLARMLTTIEVITRSPEVQQQMLNSGKSLADFPSHAIRMTVAILAAGPMLIVFPFFQKYFVRGLTLGAVKG